MALNWINEATVQLADGYTVRDHDGREIDVVHDAWIAFDGGFAHVILPDADEVQVVSAPAVWRVTYRRRG